MTIGYTGAALVDKTATDGASIQDVMVPTLTPGAAIASDSFDRVDAATLGTADQGGAWTAVAGSWRITNNRAAVTSTNSLAMCVAMLPVGTAMTEGLITADVQLSSGSARVGLVMRGTDANSFMSVDLIRSSSGLDQFRIAKRLNGASTYWVTTSPEGLTPGRGYTLAAVLTSTAVTAYLDGVVAGSYTFTAQDNIDMPGSRVGFRTWDDITTDDDGGSTYNDLVVAPSAVFTARQPAIPLAPIATATSSTSATVTWAIPGNGGSALTSFTLTCSGGQIYSGISPTATSYPATGLTTGLAQTFTVTAINALGQRISPPSNTITPTATTVPDAPTGVTAVAGNSSATVSWLAPANNGGSPIIDYTATDGVGHSITTASLSAVVTGLTNGTSYTFTVRARNAIGQSVSSSPSNTVIPVVASSIQHGWQINASNTGRAGAAAAGIANYSGTLTTLTGSRTYSTSQTIRNTTFTGDVQVTGGDVVFEFCRFTLVPPSGGYAALRIFNNGSATGTLTLNWCDFDSGQRGAQGQNETAGLRIGEASANTTGGLATVYRCSIQGYGNTASIYRWRSAAATTVTECYLANQTTGGSTHADGIELYSSDNVTVERCRILLDTSTGTSQSCVNITTDFGDAPGNPVIVRSNYINGGISPAYTRKDGDAGTRVMNCRWIGNYFGDSSQYGRECDFNAMQVTYNTAYALANPTVVLWDGANMWDPSGEGVTNPALAPSGDVPAGRPHTAGLPISSANFYGGEVFTWNGTLVGGAAETLVPGAPANVVATAGDTTATVTWSAPVSNGGAAIIDYTVTASPGGRTGTATGTSGTVTLLTNGTPYTFTVTARNSVGSSLPSRPSNAVTPTSGTITVPGQPTGVSATAGDTLATISFTAPGNNGGATIDNYRATRTPAGQTTTGTSSPITFSGLTNGTDYYFTVAAHNSAGWGAESLQSNTVRPAASSGFPDATNTGYQNAPGYPGTLTAFSGTITSGTTYNYRSFNAASVGTQSTPVSNVTFYGCRFYTSGDNACASVYATNTTFDYCTFEPTTPVAPGTPISHTAGYSNAIRGVEYYTFTTGLTVTNCNVYGFASAFYVIGSTQANPQVFRNNYLHDSRDDGGGIDHTDGIGYQGDAGNASYVTIDHNTIEALGNTQALAWQGGSSNYSNFTITNNLFGGFGYAICIYGAVSNITFTDNVFSTRLACQYGPLYPTPTSWWTSGTGGQWRRNRWRVPSGAAWGSPSHDGWYWLPVAGASQNDTTFVGQTDYTG